MKKLIVAVFMLLGFFFYAQGQFYTDSCLIAYYPFSNNAQDSSGNGNHAMVSGPSLAPDRFGSGLNSYYFDGIDDYMELPNAVRFQPLTSYSLSFWIKTFQSSRFDLFVQRIGSFSPDNHNFGIMFNVPSTGTEYVHPNYNGNNTEIKGAPLGNYNNGNWQHFVFIKDVDNSKQSIYLNNIKIVEESIVDVNYIVNGQLLIGRNHLGTYNFNGYLDDVRIYQCAIDSSRIDVLYNEQPMGVDEVKMQPVVKLFPNPTSDIVRIDSEGVDLAIVEIYNAQGGLVKRMNEDMSIVDLSELASGIYIFKMYNSQGIFLSAVPIVRY